MRENEIIEMLGDIRCAMYDILAGDELPKVLLVIDEKWICIEESPTKI